MTKGTLLSPGQLGGLMARLLKIIVQPVFVVEQDGEMVEVVAQPIPMAAAQWKALDPATWAKSGEAEVDAQFPIAEPEKLTK